jgi:uncharacterized membrane protein
MAQSDVPPQIYDVDIAEYDDSLTQAAGTTTTYEVEVENTGVMDMEITLGAERIDSDWFSSVGSVALKFQETATLTYDLRIPEDAEGMYAFSIVVFGSSGNAGVSNRKIVSLDVTPSATTPTTTRATEATTTTEPTGGPTRPWIAKNKNLILFVVAFIIGFVAIRKFF